MEHPNMKLISFSEVQKLPNGTKVYVELIGSKWNLDEKKTWNIKQADGLHYEVETEDHTISFAYDFDYDANNMSIACYVGAYGCDCCQGDEALYWKDNENNAFVDSKGEILVTVKDKAMRFKVKCCPNCGKEFLL